MNRIKKVRQVGTCQDCLIHLMPGMLVTIVLGKFRAGKSPKREA